MDSVRYVLALILLVSAPPAFLVWLIIHPFVRFWRRLGAGWTYAVVGSAVALGMLGMFRIRETLLGREFGTQGPLVILGLVVLAAALFVAVQVRRQLRVAVQIGLPELAPDRHPTELLTEGIYGRVRHPRYVAAMLGCLGWALLTNYLAVYLLAVLFVPAIHVIVVLEERELHERFGEVYREYCERVPRFLPRRRGAGAPPARS